MVPEVGLPPEGIVDLSFFRGLDELFIHLFKTERQVIISLSNLHYLPLKGGVLFGKKSSSLSGQNHTQHIGLIPY